MGAWINEMKILLLPPRGEEQKTPTGAMQYNLNDQVGGLRMGTTSVRMIADLLHNVLLILKSYLINRLICALTVMMLVGLAIPSSAYTAGEYQVKAAFMLRFLFFADWPDDANSEHPGTITIGILGDNPFKGAFDSVRGTAINERTLVVKHYDSHALSDQICNCQILFLSSSLSRNKMKEVIKSLAGCPVMTVSDIKHFTSLGGMVNFKVKKKQVTFEINNSSAKRAGIHFRAKLLRLATHVIEDKRDD